MKRETKKPLDEQRRIAVYLDGLYPIGVLRDRQAKVNALGDVTPTVSPKAGGTPPPVGGGREGVAFAPEADVGAEHS